MGEYVEVNYRAEYDAPKKIIDIYINNIEHYSGAMFIDLCEFVHRMWMNQEELRRYTKPFSGYTFDKIHIGNNWKMNLHISNE